MVNDQNKKLQYPISSADKYWKGSLRKKKFTTEDLNEASDLMDSPITFIDTPEGPRNAAEVPRVASPASTTTTTTNTAAGKRRIEEPSMAEKQTKGQAEEEEESEAEPELPKERGPGRPRKGDGPKEPKPTGRGRGRPKGSLNRKDDYNDYDYVEEE